jgi:hypothetical protein
MNEKSLGVPSENGTDRIGDDFALFQRLPIFGSHVHFYHNISFQRIRAW